MLKQLDIQCIQSPAAHPAPAKVVVTEKGILLYSSQGTQEYLYSDLKVRYTTDTDHHGELCSQDDAIRIYIEGKEFIRSLQQHAPQRITESIKEIREQKHSLLAISFKGLIIIALILGVTAGMVVGVSALGRMALMRTPPEIEIKVGKSIYDLAEKKDEIKDELVLKSIQQITTALLPSLPENPYPFDVHVLCNKEVNAHALPGGQIVIYTGLIAAAKSPEEVAGIMAHEFSHVLHRDTLQSLGNQIGITIALKLIPLGIFDIETVLGDLGPKLLHLSFSREQEEQADRKGAQILTASGIPVSGMIDFFDRLAADEGILGSALSYASSHPSSADRKAVLEELHQKSQITPDKVKIFNLDWVKISARAAELGAACE